MNDGIVNTMRNLRALRQAAEATLHTARVKYQEAIDACAAEYTNTRWDEMWKRSDEAQTSLARLDVIDAEILAQSTTGPQGPPFRSRRT